MALLQLVSLIALGCAQVRRLCSTRSHNCGASCSHAQLDPPAFGHINQASPLLPPYIMSRSNDPGHYFQTTYEPVFGFFLPR